MSWKSLRLNNWRPFRPPNKPKLRPSPWHLSKLTPKEQKLKDKWYAKLKKEGFDDIEQDEDHLKQWHSQFFIARHTNFEGRGGGRKEARFDSTWFQSQEEYYQLAGTFLHEYKFEGELERKIWELHSNGVSRVQVWRDLTDLGYKVNREGVRKTINKLSEVMVKQCQPKKT